MGADRAVPASLGPLGLGRAVSGLYSLTPASLLSWLHPGALGTPLDGRWTAPISEFYETCAGNAGLVALALAVVGLARGRRRLPAAALGLVGLALSFGPANAPLRAVLTLPVLSYLRTPARWLFLALWAVLLLAGAALARLSAPPRPRGLKSALALAAFLLLASWDAAFLSPQDPAPFLAPKPEISQYAAGRPFRVLTDPELANPNKAALYRMRNVNGYEAFYLAGVPAWARAVEGAPAADASRVFVSRWPSEALAQAGVAARLSASGLEWQKFLPLVFFIDASGRRLDAPMKIFAEEPERWRVLATPPASASGVAFLDPAYPGWRAWEDGRPVEILPWGGLFQAVALPAVRTPGVKTALTFDFRPTLWTLLASLTAAAWAAWLALALRRAEAA